MLIYIFYLLILIICAYLSWYSPQRKMVILFMLALIFIFTAFRDNIGVDTPSYEAFFNNFKRNHNIEDHYEIGYVAINRVAVWLGGSFIIVQLICVSISLYFIYKFVKTSLPIKMIGFGLVSYVCSMTYLSYMCSGVRQGLAISICLFLSRYIVKRDLKKFICGVLIAMLFHTSAIVFLPAYYIFTRKIKTSIIILLFVVAYLSAPLMKLAFDNAIGMVTGHYMGYATMFNGDANQNTGLGALARIVIWCLVAILAHRAIDPKDKESNIYFNLYVLGVCLYLINRNVDILNRFNDYFLSFFIWVFPVSIFSFKPKSRKAYIAFSAIWMLGMFLSFVYFVKDSFIPYKSYLSLY